jgi:hypothetical protein
MQAHCVPRLSLSRKPTDPITASGHQPPAHRVAADRIQQHLVQNGQLLAHDPADAEQRLGDRRQPRKVRDEFADPRLVSTARKLLQRKPLDVESNLRGTLRNFGLRVGVVSGWSAASAVPGQPASSHAPT